MKNKWFDKYTLRYASGTIIGCALIAFLYSQLPDHTRALFPPLSAWSVGIGLVSAGLAFCYISSSPMLLFHVSRFEFSSPERWKYSNHGAVLIAVTSSLIGFIFAKYGLKWTWPSSIMLSCYSVITSVQLYAVAILANRRKSIMRAYWNLCEARKYRDNGIVESYRDLREHGNALFIIIFEMALSAAFTAALKVPSLLPDPTSVFLAFAAIIVLWIAPGAYVWMVATRIEIDFVYPKGY